MHATGPEPAQEGPGRRPPLVSQKTPVYVAISRRFLSQKEVEALFCTSYMKLSRAPPLHPDGAPGDAVSQEPVMSAVFPATPGFTVPVILSLHQEQDHA